MCERIQEERHTDIRAARGCVRVTALMDSQREGKGWGGGGGCSLAQAVLFGLTSQFLGELLLPRLLRPPRRNKLTNHTKETGASWTRNRLRSVSAATTLLSRSSPPVPLAVRGNPIHPQHRGGASPGRGSRRMFHVSPMAKKRAAGRAGD